MKSLLPDTWEPLQIGLQGESQSTVIHQRFMISYYRGQPGGTVTTVVHDTPATTLPEEVFGGTGSPKVMVPTNAILWPISARCLLTAAAASPAMAASYEKASSSEGKSCLHSSNVAASLSTRQWLDDTLDKCSVSVLGRPDNLS